MFLQHTLLLQVTAVAASSLQRADEFRKRLQLTEARPHGSYDELFADPNIGEYLAVHSMLQALLQISFMSDF